MLRKLLTINIFFILTVLSAQGQEELLYLPVNAEFNNVKLDSALNILEKSSNVYFTYNANKLETERIINAQFLYMPLSIILDSIINDPYLAYRVIDRQIIIFHDETSTASFQTSNESKTKFVIQGNVYDASTQESLPFVNIGIKNSSLGTISNKDGNFILNLDESQIQNDTIVFSYMGFKSREFALQGIKKELTIGLNQNIIPLQEIVIRSADPKSIVRHAIHECKSNYLKNAVILRCFYREIMLRNNKYKLYSEGLLDIYKSPNRPTLFNNQIKLLKRRKFSNVLAEDTVEFKLQGGLQSSLDLDLVKNPLNFLEIGGLNLYKYQLIDIVTFENQLLYQIEFKPHKHNTDLSFNGTIYINTQNLAIIRVLFSYTDKSLKKLKNAFIYRKSRNIKVNVTNANYEVSYRQTNGKHYIHRIHGNLKIKVKKRNKFLASNFETKFELVSTDMENSNIKRFDRKETIKPNRVFTDVLNDYNPDFWTGDNFILPEADLTKALERFNVEELKLNSD